MSKKKSITAAEQQPASEDAGTEHAITPAQEPTPSESTLPVGTEAPAPTERPVKAVWRVCREMHEKNPEVKRSAIITACLELGLNRNTVCTQVQKFKASQKAKK